MYCHDFVNNKKSAVILSCRRKFVSDYLSKGFVILNNNSSELRDIPLWVTQRINSEKLLNYDFLIEYKRSIPSAENTFKSIHNFLLCLQNFHQRSTMTKMNCLDFSSGNI